MLLVFEDSVIAEAGVIVGFHAQQAVEKTLNLTPYGVRLRYGAAISGRRR